MGCRKLWIHWFPRQEPYYHRTWWDKWEVWGTLFDLFESLLDLFPLGWLWWWRCAFWSHFAFCEWGFEKTTDYWYLRVLSISLCWVLRCQVSDFSLSEGHSLRRSQWKQWTRQDLEPWSLPNPIQPLRRPKSFHLIKDPGSLLRATTLWSLAEWVHVDFILLLQKKHRKHIGKWKKHERKLRDSGCSGKTMKHMELLHFGLRSRGMGSFQSDLWDSTD